MAAAESGGSKLPTIGSERSSPNSAKRSWPSGVGLKAWLILAMEPAVCGAATPGVVKSFEMRKYHWATPKGLVASVRGNPEADVGDAVAVHVGGDRLVEHAGEAPGHRRVGRAEAVVGQVEREDVVVEDREIDFAVAVEIADDRRAEEGRVDERVAGVDDEVVVRVEGPFAGVVEADFVAVGGVVVEVAGDGNRAGDAEIGQRRLRVEDVGAERDDAVAIGVDQPAEDAAQIGRVAEGGELIEVWC